MTNAAVNPGVPVTLWVFVWNPLRYMPRNKIACHMILLCWILQEPRFTPYINWFLCVCYYVRRWPQTHCLPLPASQVWGLQLGSSHRRYCHFPHGRDKILDKGTQGKKDLLCLTDWGHRVHRGRESLASGTWGSWWQCVIVRKQRQINAGAQLLLFIWSKTPAHGILLPTFRVGIVILIEP